MNNQYTNEEKASIQCSFGYLLLNIGYFTFKMLINELVV